MSSPYVLESGSVSLVRANGCELSVGDTILDTNIDCEYEVTGFKMRKDPPLVTLEGDAEDTPTFLVDGVESKASSIPIVDLNIQDGRLVLNPSEDE